MENALSRIRSIADFQFGKEVGVKLFPKNVDIKYSKALAEYATFTLKAKGWQPSVLPMACCH